MTRSGRILASVGHVAVLASLDLPWLSGEFGNRAALTALQLAALLNHADSLAPPVSVTAFAYGVPLVAVQGALVWPVGTALRLPRGSVRTVEVALVTLLVTASVAFAAAAAIGARRSALVDGPAAGVLVALAGCALVLSASRLGDRIDGHLRGEQSRRKPSDSG